MPELTPLQDRLLKLRYRNNERAMVRELLLILIGKDRLKNMSATGRGGWDRIPQNTLNFIQCEAL